MLSHILVRALVNYVLGVSLNDKEGNKQFKLND
jgi:hypothetical protein